MKRKNRVKSSEGEERNKRNVIVLALILLVLLFVTLIINFVLISQKPLYEEEILVLFEIGEEAGITTTTEELDFGRVVPGNSVGRVLFLKNDYSFPLEIQAFISSELDGYVFGKRSVILQAGEQIDYGVSLKIPEDSAFGSVAGRIRFEGRKVEA